MKIIRFETTCNETIEGCNHPDNLHKIMFVDIPTPENADKMDQYELTAYVEKTTNLFCIGYLKVINKPVETTNEYPKYTCKVCKMDFEPICSESCGCCLL